MPLEGFDQGDYSSASPPGSDTSLTSLLGVEKYVQNGDSFERHWVPDVQNIFRTAPADLLTKQLPDIMKTFSKFADDAPLKSELLKVIPDIAAQAIENSQRVEALKDVLGEYLLPLVLRNLGCSDTGYHKIAQATLVQLLQRGYVTRVQAEIKICPSILALTSMENQMDVNTSAVSLMSKLAPLLGKDITERILLKRFTELCSSSLFYVRKQAASHCGYFCTIIGKEEFEKTLLPCFLAQCQDEIWGVRKSCAEVIMFLSSVCPAELRRTLLADAVAKLLHDECRWVRMAAFQTLGGFIATFAEPPLTSIDLNANGDLVLVNKDGNEFRSAGIEGVSSSGSLSAKELYTLFEKGPHLNEASTEGTDLRNLDLYYMFNDDNSESNVGSCVEVETTPLSGVEVDKNEVKTGSSSNADPVKHEDDLLSYNEYYYWHLSPPEVDVRDLLDDADGSLDDSVEDLVTNHLEEMYAGIKLDSPKGDIDETQPIIEISSDNKGDNLDLKSEFSRTPKPLYRIVEIFPPLRFPKCSSIDISANITDATKVTEPPQKIVPHCLVEDFVWMARGNNSTNSDMFPDMSHHCAYALPAVVLTLGRDNWHLLRDAMNILAKHTSYKIRRIVASSLHEVAVILGPELASTDLSPLFEEFLKDLDEVRIGVLNNLFLFMQLINVEKRTVFLPKLDEFLRVDNVCNWRFQEQLAEQLTQCVQLFRPADVVKYIGFYAQALMFYNVAAVRQASLLLVTEIVKHISKDHGLTSSYLSEIAERFAHSKKWKPRQTFAILCAEILKKEAMEPEEFGIVMLPHLLDLSWDPVPNIRLVVADCVVNCVVKTRYFVEPENEHVESLNNVLRRLQADKDRDVRMFAECPTF
ncbi:serine/threonine-protein phosphatase 4 regulatory subunit 1-like isoform X4 [Euwallacea fornicatus]|uniref:serine/threonine-protein phosphatase 4 regulatory subunit 1-like isoform X4 n=1 Tax=Euwallacea fornicatus TaxID=995702 RepID=UPI00338E7108